MPTNDIKPFAAAGGANVLTQAEYLALAALSTGFSSGKANSKEVNKAIRQATFIASALAQFICDKSGSDVLDDGNVAGLVTKLLSAMNKTSQPLDATLTALAGLVGAANKLPYFNGADTAALTDLTPVGRDIIGKSNVAAVLQYLGLANYADKASLANQEFSGPVSSKDSVTATSPDGVTRKVSLNASTGLQIVIYDGGTYKGAITIPAKDGIMALVSDLANFADKKTSDSQVFTAPVVSNDGIVAQSGTSKVILSAQNGLKLITYQNNQYAGGVEIPKRDGVIALTADLFGVSQTWQNVKGSRNAGVTYTNSTGRPIAVSIAGIMASNQTGVQLSLAVNGVEASSFAVTQASFDIRGNVFAIVPPGATYNLTASSITSILTWSELR